MLPENTIAHLSDSESVRPHNSLPKIASEAITCPNPDASVQVAGKAVSQTFAQLKWIYTLFFWGVSLGIHLAILNRSIPEKQQQVLKPIKLTRLVDAPPLQPSKSPSKLPRKNSTPVLGNTRPSSLLTKPLHSALPPRAAVPQRQQLGSALSPVSKLQPPVTPQSNPASIQNLHQTAPPTATAVLKTFPTYPGADSSCTGLCFKTNHSVEAVATFFQKTLASQQWQTELTHDDSAQKVYRISKGNVTQVLSVVAAGPLGTLYALADQAVNYQDLTQAEAAIATVSDLLAEIKGIQPVDRFMTAQPELFQADTSILSMNWIEHEPPAAVFETYFRQELFGNGFEVNASNAFGGGPVYQIKQGQFTGYLNLVPSKTAQGTVIVLWKTPPA